MLSDSAGLVGPRAVPDLLTTAFKGFRFRASAVLPRSRSKARATLESSRLRADCTEVLHCLAYDNKALKTSSRRGSGSNKIHLASICLCLPAILHTRTRKFKMAGTQAICHKPCSVASLAWEDSTDGRQGAVQLDLHLMTTLVRVVLYYVLYIYIERERRRVGERPDVLFIH